MDVLCRGICVLSLLMLTVSCSTENELDENREKWQRLNISSYSLEMHNTGLLPGDKRLITVKNYSIESVYLFSDSVFAEDSVLPDFTTIDDLFDIVAKAMKSAKKVRVRYDDTYGFPEGMYADYGEEGDGFEVTEFLLLEP